MEFANSGKIIKNSLHKIIKSAKNQMFKKTGYAFLLFCLFLAHASFHLDKVSAEELEGEKGRPKTVPMFRSYPGSSDKTVNPKLQCFDLNGKPIHLKKLYQEKPLLLVHSSLTCPISRDNCPHVDRIMKLYKSEVNVVVLYTTEAHPIESPSPYSEGGKHEWITYRNVKEKILVDEPQTIKSRIKRAKKYQQQHHIESSMIVDSMSNSVWKYFGAGPNCGVLIDSSGAVSSHHGWLEPSMMEGSIRELITRKQNKEIDAKLAAAKIKLPHLDIDELLLAIKKVPECVHYRLSRRGVPRDATFLHLFVDRRKLADAKTLLEHGALSNAKDAKGLTPLHYVLQSHYGEKQEATPLLELLIKNGANISETTDDLRTSLFLAVESELLWKVEFAIQAGVFVDTPNIHGITPLHESLFLGCRDIADKLIAADATTDIYVAAATGDLKQVKRFVSANSNAWLRLQGHPITAVNLERSPLMYAVAGGQTEIIKYLLKQQTKTERYSNEHLIACLHKGIELEQENAALLLVPHITPLKPAKSTSGNFFVSRPSYHSLDPLTHEAARAGLHLLVTSLVKHGWDVDQLNPDERTPLHCAGSLETTKALLDLGANINAKSGRRRPSPCGPGWSEPLNKTALHNAVADHSFDVVKLLLERGAKMELRDHEGATPLLSLLPRYYDEEKENFESIEKTFRVLIKHGADLTAKDSSGKNLKTIAAEVIEVRRLVDGQRKEVKEMRCEKLLQLLKKEEK